MTLLATCSVNIGDQCDEFCGCSTPLPLTGKSCLVCGQDVAVCLKSGGRSVQVDDDEDGSCLSRRDGCLCEDWRECQCYCDVCHKPAREPVVHAVNTDRKDRRVPLVCKEHVEDLPK